MSGAFERTEMLLGTRAMDHLADCRVAVFGVGGVGGYVVEALARTGVGALDLIDHDRVSESNLNRQIIATRETIGMFKVRAAAERVASIAPACTVRGHQTMFLPDTQDQFAFGSYDYVVDAIDTVTGKLALITCAQAAGVPVISSMGAGNKLDAASFRVADIYETRICPLARVMRRECKKRGIQSLKVVYSEEKPIRPRGAAADARAEAAPGDDASAHMERGRRDIPGSVAFVPAAAGLIIAGEVVRDLTEGVRNPSA